MAGVPAGDGYPLARPLIGLCGHRHAGARRCPDLLCGLQLARRLARPYSPSTLPHPRWNGTAMLLTIPEVLSREDALALRERIAAAEWVDGNVTSGSGAATAKRNRQLPEEAPITQAAQAEVTSALMDNGAFLSAALPHSVFPPLFNRYGGGEEFGLHVDNSIRFHGASGARIRTDLSCTLFLTDPEDYDGGELEIEGSFGAARYKLPAGHAILYPSTSLHRVTPVTRGERISCFFWLQSLVADHAAREMLYDLDQSVQTLSEERGKKDKEVLRLTALYHNLVRRWAQA